MPVTGGSWIETTNRPYSSDDLRYRDPSASNSGGGAGPDDRVYAATHGRGIWSIPKP